MSNREAVLPTTPAQRQAVEALSVDSDAFVAGRVVGGLAAATQGVLEFDAGAGAISGGVVACGTGVLCPAGVGAVAGGAVVAAHGASVAIQGAAAAGQQANILFSSGNYRDRFYRQYPNAPRGDPIHHRIPQKARELDLFTAAEVDSVDNLRAVPLDWHKKITKEWGEFWRQHPNAGRQDVLDFADHIDEIYGQYFYQP
jgi:hypothetical protein